MRNKYGYDDHIFGELRKQALAQIEPCGFCHAEAGELCINSVSGRPLEHIPAHFARLKKTTYPTWGGES